MAQGKKRVGNLAAKAKRARSWAKNQAAKTLRIADQKTREEHNRQVGSTGRQRAQKARSEAHKAKLEREKFADAESPT